MARLRFIRSSPYHILTHPDNSERILLSTLSIKFLTQDVSPIGIKLNNGEDRKKGKKVEISRCDRVVRQGKRRVKKQFSSFQDLLNNK
jgi:hypothetical protein